MSKKYKFRNSEGLFFVTSTIIHWIDLFTRREYAEIVIDSLNECVEKKGLRVHRWVIMPSHFHAIVSTVGEPLDKIMQAIKSFSSRQFIKTINEINESRSDWLLNALARLPVKTKEAPTFWCGKMDRTH